MLLVVLSPETLWDMKDLDFKEIKRVPHFIEMTEFFLKNSTCDQRNLFIMNAITRIAKKNLN